MGLIKDAVLLGVGAYLGYRYGRGREIETAAQAAVASVQEAVAQVTDLTDNIGGAVTDLDPGNGVVPSVMGYMGRRYCNQCGGYRR